MPEWDKATEKMLVRTARKGDKEAYGRLYDHYAPLVFRFLFAHLDDRQDAEDLAVEVFMRVWRALSGYRERGAPFGAFIFRVARNALIDHYRRGNNSDLPLEEHHADGGQSDPAEALPARLERDKVRQALSGLRGEQRVVLELRFLAELSTEEIGLVMGKSSGAVRVMQHRALAALRKRLEELEVSNG